MVRIRVQAGVFWREAIGRRQESHHRHQMTGIEFGSCVVSVNVNHSAGTTPDHQRSFERREYDFVE